jgi:hypothetical protein
MKNALKKINELIKTGILDKYAIAGGMAQFYYIEPSVTYDLDLIIHIPGQENNLDPLKEIYAWADENNYKSIKEHIIIEGIPVQFLLAYNDLVKTALKERRKIKIFDVDTFILKPEYLMAILLQTGRLTDKERLAKFLTDAKYDNDKFLSILEKFDLSGAYNKFKKINE